MTSWGEKVSTVNQLTYSWPRENNAHIYNHLHCPSCCTCAAHAIRTSLKKSKQCQAATRRLLSRLTRAPEAAAAAQAECRWHLILILGAAPRVAAPPSARQQQPHRTSHPRRRRSPCHTPARSGSPKRMCVGIITTPLQHRAAISAAGHAAQEAAECRGEGGNDRGAGSHRKPRGGGQVLGRPRWQGQRPRRRAEGGSSGRGGHGGRTSDRCARLGAGAVARESKEAGAGIAAQGRVGGQRPRHRAGRRGQRHQRGGVVTGPCDR